jgi:hypothetical protein
VATLFWTGWPLSFTPNNFYFALKFHNRVQKFIHENENSYRSRFENSNLITKFVPDYKVHTGVQNSDLTRYKNYDLSTKFRPYF